ncbi:MAG: cobalamin biosynthesis protein [Euryarchaeota archaeon]|nr:cobalamin biosynthesis protein [Euryarchaeota archaeon]
MKDGYELGILPLIIAIPIIALLLDLIIGDPPNRFHPVAWIGHMIGILDNRILRGNPAAEKIVGAFAVILPALFFISLFTLILALTRELFGAIIWTVASAIIFKMMFAIRSLETHTAPIAWDLRKGDLDAAREKVSMVVSRDVNNLDAPHIISCASETVSENLVDSVLSPMFYFGIAGVPGAILLRVVNTADGMIGYISERHRYVGWFAARADDIMHYITARLSVPFIILSLILLRKDWRRGWRAAFRDHKQTSSPNKGWPIAATAGGLGTRFEKDGYYSMGEGELSDDPTIILDTIRVMKVTSLLFFLLILIPLFTLLGIHVQLSFEDGLLDLLR